MQLTGKYMYITDRFETSKIYSFNGTACEVGTYGVNCTGGSCKYGFYGFGCQSKCSCTSDQYCDRRTGCVNKTSKGIADKKERSYISTVVAVIMAVILSVGSFLVVIVFFYNERLKFLHQYLTRLGTNRVVNNASRESEQEDYSQMTRASDNYNMLIPNKRINVVSRVNYTDEEDSYDHIRPFANSQPEES
ncbi:uncharacterized protein LOC133205655 [Saccostrea echinata]|uniref:uncharacterized protein LOC133205655 n=1 Tax=Saccostrea echinata TaxID=191078 RepID=UPI002A7F61D7|nr:uncharacterized protein LOC133205655 [Saccostrea echinata]